MMNLQDLQAVAELTAEKLYVKPCPTVQVKDVIRGRARWKTNTLTIPRWAEKLGETYPIYYVVHEVCHYIQKGHGEAFKYHERSCLGAWGIVPQYMRAYPRKLMSTAGDTLYTRPKKLMRDNGEYVYL